MDIEQFDEFTTTLKNNLTNEKLFIKSRQFGDSARVEIQRLPLNSAIFSLDMFDRFNVDQQEKVPYLKIDMFETILSLILTIIFTFRLGKIDD